MAIRGMSVAITRSRDDAAEFVSLAEGSGATPIPLPTIELTSRGDGIVDEFLNSLGSYRPDYSVFMSSKAVRLLFGTARDAGRLDALRLAVANTTVMSVGPKTTAALEEQGIRVSHQPSVYSSVGVGEEFTRINAAGRKAIVPRSSASTPFLKELLEKIGMGVLEVHLYDVCAFRDTSQWNGFRGLFSRGGVDGIVFTSASSVRGFFEIMSRDWEKDQLLGRLEQAAVVAIGPFTSAELQKFGVRNTVAEVHTVRGAFDELESRLGGAP